MLLVNKYIAKEEAIKFQLQIPPPIQLDKWCSAAASVNQTYSKSVTRFVLITRGSKYGALRNGKLNSTITFLIPYSSIGRVIIDNLGSRRCNLPRTKQNERLSHFYLIFLHLTRSAHVGYYALL